MWWFLSACTPEPEISFGATVARFEVDAPALGALPFPSELFLDADGAPSLGPLPNPRDGTPTFEALRALLASRDGFCGTCAVRFGLRGGAPVLPASLTSGRLEDPVVVVDLEMGEAVPLELHWDAEREMLAARPARGHLFRSGHRHVALLTAALQGEDGLPVGPDRAFLEARDGRGPKPAVAMVQDALDALGRLGVERARVTALGAFTPEDPTRDLWVIRDLLEARAPARPVVDRVFVGDALDELLGIPSDERPGIDIPPVEGSGGTRSLRHATTRAVVTGTFRAPRWLSGEGSALGLLLRDEQGLPATQLDDEVPFVLIVPEQLEPGPLPVVISHHGFNASRTTAFALADTAGRAGYAVLGIDAFQHGARAASAADELFAMRGEVRGQDGFAETFALDVSGRMFGLFGTDPDLAMFPGYPLAAFTQFAADALSAVQLVQRGDWSLVASADPALEDLQLDAGHLAFVGNSMGAVVGTQVLAAQPPISAAVLNVMPGAIVDTLCESGEFRSMAESLLLPTIGVQGPFDEDQRKMAFDPTVDLVRWALEPVDPLALSPWLLDADRSLLVQLAGHDEVAAPGPSESVVSASGLAGIGDFALAPVPAGSLPASAVAVRFDGAMHGMMEVRDQASRYQEPLVPPLQRRPTPEPVTNPIETVHDQIEQLLRSEREQDHGVVE